MINHRLPGLGLRKGLNSRHRTFGDNIAAETEIPPIIIWGDGNEKGDEEKDEEREAQPKKIFAFHFIREYAVLAMQGIYEHEQLSTAHLF